MSKSAKKFWQSFGTLLSLFPNYNRPAAQKVMRMRAELANRSDRDMLYTDFCRVGDCIKKSMMENQHG